MMAWRGMMIIRRFLDISSNNGVPLPNAPISLGTWYGEDVRKSARTALGSRRPQSLDYLGR
jgi:hypothetical protein